MTQLSHILPASRQPTFARPSRDPYVTKQGYGITF
jgi:hypothetical protein